MDASVSCLMVTANRPGLAARAIACHARQTHTNSELVILDDGDVDYSPVIERFGAPGRVRYLRIVRDHARTLGELRNMSMRAADGEWFIQWDDDEWFGPQRIESQLNAALSAGVGASALKWTLMTIEDEPNPLTFRADTGLATPGTILYRRTEVLYPSMRRNEDGEFLREIRREMGLTVLGKGESHHFVRVHHGGNTWERSHFERRLRRVPSQWPSWFVARYLRGDVTTHPAFRLTSAESLAVGEMDAWNKLEVHGAVR